MEFLPQQSPAGKSASWSTAKQQFTTTLQLLSDRLEHSWHEATFSFGQGFSHQIGKQMCWDCGFACSCLAFTECSWYLQVQCREFCMKLLQDKQIKNKRSSFSEALLLLTLYVLLLLFCISFWDSFLILSNLKMDQQENSFALSIFKEQIKMQLF